MYTAIVSRINSKTTLHKILEDASERALREVATTWIIDSVGKNNFIDTLDDPRQPSEYQIIPMCYVLKFAEGNPNKILLYKNTSSDNGWVRSYVETISEQIGEFELVPAPFDNTYKHDCEKLREKIASLNHEIELLREDAKYAVRTHSTPKTTIVRNDVHDRTIDLIRNFDMSSLRKVKKDVVVDVDVDAIDYDTDYDDGYVEVVGDEYSIDIIDDNDDCDIDDNDDDIASKLENFSDGTIKHIYEISKKANSVLAEQCLVELECRGYDRVYM